MKKIILALVVLVFAAPAWANVVITCAQVADTNEVVISFDATTEANLVRAFSLNIQLDDDAVILGVGNVNADYYIHPGTIQISNDDPPTINYGSPVAEYGDLPSDTLPGLDSNGITIEMGSLYAPTDPCSPTPPAKSGVLLSIYVSEPADLETCLTISGNVARAGSKGVVMEDPDEDPTVDPSGCCVVFAPDTTCWTITECAGQPQGDATCDGAVNLADLMALKGAWGASAPWTAPKCCADFDQSGSVNLADLMALKAGWGAMGITPSTLNQNCP